MHLFVSAGEPSGDLHAGNLVRSLRDIDPALTCAGFGGDRLAAAGAQLLYPLTRLSVMWFPHVLKSIRTFLGLIDLADDYFRDRRPDAVVLIDYPGLHWWLARRAKERGIPVFYFVPPQLWAGGGWRVAKMRRYVDHVICSLPFEPTWYAGHGITAHYFGHPYSDELNSQGFEQSFVTQQLAAGQPIVAVLPGSRQQELRMNWSALERAIELVHARRPDARFVVGAFNESQRQLIASSLSLRDLPAEVHAGRTPEIIRSADMCLSVSGSVGLELLHAALPSIVAYRIRRIDVPFVRLMMKSRYLSLVNLLAGEELFPEFLTWRCPAAGMAATILDWLNDPTELDRRRRQLSALRKVADRPGACQRTADYILRTLGSRSSAAACVNSESPLRAGC